MFKKEAEFSPEKAIGTHHRCFAANAFPFYSVRESANGSYLLICKTVFHRQSIAVPLVFTVYHIPLRLVNSFLALFKLFTDYSKTGTTESLKRKSQNKGAKSESTVLINLSPADWRKFCGIFSEREAVFSTSLTIFSMQSPP